MDYYNHNSKTTSAVNYKLLTSDGKVIHEYNGEACFSAITYYPVKQGTEVVRIKHMKSMLPYSVDAIKRWVSDLVEMGFPIYFLDDVVSEAELRNNYVRATTLDSVNEIADKILCHGQEVESKADDRNYYHFDIRFADFEYKSHFVSTLMFVRCLTESGICKIPEIYFQLMDKNPNADKFDMLQTAHKKEHYGNINHMATHIQNGSNVSKETLLARYQACGVKVREHKGYNIGQSDKWNGSTVDWKPKHTENMYG